LAQEVNPCAALTDLSDPAIVSQCAIAAEAAWAAAEKTDTVKGYRGFRVAHPGSTHDADALEKEAAAALRDVEALDTPLAWRQLRAHYPVHERLSQEREIKAVAKAIGESAELEVPCETADSTADTPDDKKPTPSCGFIPAEALIRATWTTPEEYHARPQLVGWDGEKAVPLTTLQRKIGAAPYASEYAAIVQVRKGGMDETGWRVEIPVDLKLPPGHGLVGYAVQLTVMGQPAAVLPFIITEEWPDMRVRTR